jgi:hypothetical protein
MTSNLLAMVSLPLMCFVMFLCYHHSVFGRVLVSRGKGGAVRGNVTVAQKRLRSLVGALDRVRNRRASVMSRSVVGKYVLARRVYSAVVRRG